jgi:hypothetical protein
LGPNGTSTSQAAAPAPKSNTRKAASKTPAAPDPVFFLLDPLRRTILLISTLLLLQTRKPPAKINYL